MTLTNKILITAVVLTVLTCGTFIIYKQIEISDRQKAIESSLIEQKQIAENLVRSSSKYATENQLTQFIKDNKIDLDAIKKDIAGLGVKIDSINIVITSSSGTDWTDLPSTSVSPSDAPAPSTKIECNGKTLECVQDPHKYLATKQSLDVNEKFGDVNVPFGVTTFDGSKDKPWSLKIPQRDYKTVVVSAIDENQRVVNYNQFTITIDGKEYKLPITKAETQQKFPDPVFRWFSPRLYLGLDGGVIVNGLSGEFGPSLNLAIMNYGRYNQTPDFSILQLGLGAGLVSRSMYVDFTPFAYNIGKHFPFIMNTYLGPSISVSTHGDFAVMAGLRIGL